MVELLAAMTVLTVGILALFAMLESGMVHIRRAATVTTAAALAETEMENFRALRFDKIGLDDADVAAGDATYKSDSAYREDTPTTELLLAVLDSTTTSINVTSAAGFPSKAPFRIKVDNEVMLVTAGAGTTTWTVTRGVDGTTATPHALTTVKQKQRVHVPKCSSGASPCTDSVPTKTVPGADGRSYRVDTYMTWQLTSSSSGQAGRNAKLVTIVVRNAAVPARVYARISSSFDEATGR